MNIRLANKGDIPGLIRLLRQVGQVHHEIRPDIFPRGTQKYNEAALEALLEDENSPVFVAVEAEAMLGYCFCQLRRFRAGVCCVSRQELYIDDLCVEETCRGQGVAGHLFAYVKTWAKEAGFDFITLNVWSGNEPAMNFYEKAGMRPRNMTMELALEEL